MQMRFDVTLVLRNAGSDFYKTAILELFKRVELAFICSSVVFHYKENRTFAKKINLYLVLIHIFGYIYFLNKTYF